MQLPNTVADLFQEVTEFNLFHKLIIQLNKDLALANVDLEFDEETLPTSLKLVLQDTVSNLIQDKFSEYLNLLYIIDVPEKAIIELDGSETAQFSEQVTFLILEREWQKVYYRHLYS